LARVAAALACFRTKTGHYPSSLKELAPAILPTAPLDPYSGQPFVYERRGDGYLLYSVFENGVDDRGSDVEEPIIAGEWVEPDSFTQPLPNEADLVIRLPLSPANWRAQAK
jgi:hypothetical protein